MADVKVPEVGESITEVFIGAWLKNEGDTVAQDEPLVEIETDKATLEVPAPVAGVLSGVLKKQGDAATVGEGGDEGAQGFGRAAAAPDHATPVFGVDVHLEHVAARRRGRVDADVVRVIDDPLDDVFERGRQHGNYSAEVSAASADACS